jgi:hypothetical protein
MPVSWVKVISRAFSNASNTWAEALYRSVWPADALMGPVRDNTKNKTLIKHVAAIDFFMIVPPLKLSCSGFRQKHRNLFCLF